jgi:hypothetical protein
MEAMWRVFIQENGPNLNKSHKLCGVLTCCSSAFPSLALQLENHQLKVTMKTSSGQPLNLAEQHLHSCKVSFPKNYHYFTSLVVSWKTLFTRFVMWPD